MMCDPDCLVKGLGLMDPVLCSGRGYEGKSEFEKNLQVTLLRGAEMRRNKLISNVTLSLYKTILKSIEPGFPSCKTDELLQKLSDEPKSAYVTWTREIDQRRFFFQQKKPELTFFKGKENFLSQSQHWTFTKIPHTSPYFRMVQLMSSGIYKYWQYWLQLQEAEYKNKKWSSQGQGLKISALSSKSNLFFVFYILLLGFALASCAFLSEMAAKLAIRGSNRFKVLRSKGARSSVTVLAGVNDETPLEM